MQANQFAEKFSYQEDITKEGKEPDEQITLPKGALNEAKFSTWWGEYNAMFNSSTNNCATVVYTALCVGGASVPRSTQLWAAVPTPWTLTKIGQYAKTVTFP